MKILAKNIKYPSNEKFSKNRIAENDSICHYTIAFPYSLITCSAPVYRTILSGLSVIPVPIPLFLSTIIN